MSNFSKTNELRDFLLSIERLAGLGPDRLTLTQASFFMHAAIADLSGKPSTFTEIREIMGDSINKSLHSTYKVFVDESRNRGIKREPGLGWLARDVDPADNRRKYLRLTAIGRGVLSQVFER